MRLNDVQPFVQSSPSFGPIPPIKVVFSKNMSDNQMNIELNVPAGLYILKVETAAGSSERKIVVE